MARDQWKVLYLATGPGLLGHTGFNFLLRWLAPLVVSLALTLEPLVGSLLGWAVGVTGAPTPLECLGGVMLMVAMAAVTISSHRRETQKAECIGEVEGLHYDVENPTAAGATEEGYGAVLELSRPDTHLHGMNDTPFSQTS